MRETLPEEPPASDDVAAVRFQLPQGVKLARRFHKTHTVKVIIIIINCRLFLIYLSFLFSYFVQKLAINIMIQYFNIILLSCLVLSCFNIYFSFHFFSFLLLSYLPTFCDINLLLDGNLTYD